MIIIVANSFKTLKLMLIVKSKLKHCIQYTETDDAVFHKGSEKSNISYHG